MRSLEPQGGDSTTIWHCPKDLELELQASLQLLTNLDPAAQSEPFSSRKEKVGDQRSDPSPWINPGNCQGPSGPHCLSESLTQEPSSPSPVPTGSGEDTRPEGGRGAVPALVTSQCQMQIGKRHGLPGLQQPIGRRECAPAAAGGDRQRPRSWGRREPPG